MADIVELQLIDGHLRPPGDRLFGCGGSRDCSRVCSTPREPAIPLVEREHFAAAFAGNFVQALIEVREPRRSGEWKAGERKPGGGG